MIFLNQTNLEICIEKRSFLSFHARPGVEPESKKKKKGKGKVKPFIRK